MSNSKNRITIKEGGWVLILMGILLLLIIIWAIAPAIFRMNNTTLGDGETVASYQFNLTDLQINQEVFFPVMNHRNMTPTLTMPKTLSSEEIEIKNRYERSPFLVSKDLVVGLEINGEVKAYPFHMLHVHEIINDTVGGIPIVISWHWPSGHLAVHERTINGEPVDFANCGIAGNGCLIMYPMQKEPGGEQLFSPVLSQSVSGSKVALIPVPHEVTSWANWTATHPTTTCIKPDASYKKRYRKSDPKAYFLNDTIYFPALPMPVDAINPKTAIIAIPTRNGHAVYAIDSFLDKLNAEGKTEIIVDEQIVIISASETPLYATAHSHDGSVVQNSRALWFAWHANHPEDLLLKP